jgi:hypothetical protein
MLDFPVAGADLEHLSPTLAYRFAGVIDVS